jgi:hypothetical protein
MISTSVLVTAMVDKVSVMDSMFDVLVLL